ncbi:MAG: translation elongation factor Ts [Clostridiales Family XIII bacterium]|jgi:elongation factor Ts|nr:translation elongation factor Ts [Clostridiales Family XIII bacterium]
MAITATAVKELRERTGAGMLDCKNVLVEVEGNIEKAIDVLREKGLAKAAKKSGRIAAEGLVRVVIADGGKKAGIIEVNIETDFASKNEEFIKFVDTLAAQTLTTGAPGIEEFLGDKYGGTAETVQGKLTNFIAKIGENVTVRRFKKFGETGVVYVGYLHLGGKIGVVIGLATEAAQAEVETLGRDVAMQVASMNPQFVDESGVDPAYIEKEKEILVKQALSEGKPAEIVEKMVMGRLKKELKETCLLEQKFVKNNELTVAQYVSDVSKAIGKDVKVVSMVRYEVGEGIEKKEENFAEEVAKQMQQ